MKQNKNKINVVETWFLVGKKIPIAFAKNLWKVYTIGLKPATAWTANSFTANSEL